MTFELIVGLGEELRRALRERRVDVIIGPTYGADLDEFKSTILSQDVMVVVARKGHPLAGRAITPEELADYSWLLGSPRTPSIFWLFAELAGRNVRTPKVQVQAGSINAVRQVIAQTNLLTFLSRRDLSAGGGSKLIELDVSGLTYERHLAVTWSAVGHTSSAAERVIDLIHKEGEAILARPQQ